METAPAKTYMESDAVPMTDEERDWQAYLLKKKDLGPGRRPSPPGIKFHGDKGKYSISYWDKDAKETAFKDIESPSGVILAVRWSVRWRYDVVAVFDIFTREFSAFRGEQIELIQIDKQNSGAEFKRTVFPDYQAFKAAMAMTDPVTKDVEYPFELSATAYLYAPGIENPQEATVFRCHFNGTTRSAFFDYLKGGVSEYLTELGVSDPQKMGGDKTKKKKKGDEDLEGKVFYTGTFTRHELPPEWRKGVMKADAELASFLEETRSRQSGEKPAEIPPKPPAPRLEEPFTDDGSLPPDAPVQELPPMPEEDHAQIVASAFGGKVVKDPPKPPGAVNLITAYDAKIKKAASLEELDLIHGEIKLDRDVHLSPLVERTVNGLVDARIAELAEAAKQAAMLPPPPYHHND